MLRRRFSFIVSALGTPLAASVCAAGVAWASGKETGDPVNGTVLFLMAAPYLVAGSIAGWLVYRHWRAAAKKNGEAKKGSVLHLAWKDKESER